MVDEDDEMRAQILMGICEDHLRDLMGVTRLPISCGPFGKGRAGDFKGCQRGCLQQKGLHGQGQRPPHY
jgi:hypothetical protein